MDLNGPSGVLLIDKAPDMTSHDVVAIARRALNTKKIGHCGTLDPMATGLLMLVIGRATKIQDLLMSEDKEYVGTLTLGATTSTQDRQGEMLETKPVPAIIPRSKSSRPSTPSPATSSRCRRWFPRSRRTACRSTNSPARARDRRTRAAPGARHRLSR